MKRFASGLVLKRFATQVMGVALLVLSVPMIAMATGTAGTVLNMNGTVTAKSADGTLKVLAPQAAVSSGDTLYTGKESFARVKFADGGEIILRANSNFKVENFNFDEKDPGKDSAGFNLLKGSLRALSGSIGKRGDPDSYAIKTPTATAGIRGTLFGMLYCKGDCADIPTPSGAPPEDGLHVDVEQGTVIVKSGGGNQLFNAGEHAYVRDSNSAPTTVPPEKAVPVRLAPRIAAEIAKVPANNKTENKPASGDSLIVVPDTGGPAKECTAK